METKFCTETGSTGCKWNNRTGIWRDIWYRFRKNRLAVFGLFLVASLVLLALLAPYITVYDPYEQLIWTEGKGVQLQPPGAGHWFGTDVFGRDVFSRVIFGARISLQIGIISTVISLIIGITMGAIAGYFGGIADDIISWLINVTFAFPFLLFVLVLVVYLPPSLLVIYAAIGLVNWVDIARVVRGQVLSVKGKEYVEAAVALGENDMRVILKYVLPNAIAPVIVQATLGIGNIIMLESALSFLGFGVQPPEPSWGAMINAGRPFLIAGKWWWSVFPGIGIMVMVLGFNLVGDGLRDALDPRQ